MDPFNRHWNETPDVPQPDDDYQARCKIAYVDVSFMLACLNAQRKGWIMSLPITPEIPEGTIAQDVHYDFSRRAFAVRLYHPSWPPVDPGCLIPALDGGLLDLGTVHVRPA